MRPELAIVTLHHDLHAFAVMRVLKERHGLACHVIASDSLANTGGLSWEPVPVTGCAPTLPTVDKRQIDVRNLGAVWWRRFNGLPQIPESVMDPAARDVIANDCRATLVGILNCSFRGQWVSHYEATRRAEIKPVQLDAAVRAGFRVPRTLVSQDPKVIRQFCEALDYRVVIKPVAGTHMTGIAAGRATPALLSNDESLRLSPAIYQELIDGQHHLRVHVFGDQIHAALLKSEYLDWRNHLDTLRIEQYQLSARTCQQLQTVLRLLDLRMGVFDFKLGLDGEPIWFEVNPQGQFLFIEGLSDIKLTEYLADFLYEEANRGMSHSNLDVEISRFDAGLSAANASSHTRQYSHQT